MTPNNPNIEEIAQRIVGSVLDEEEWSVHKPEGGWSSTTYFAERLGRRVVVKLENGAEVWRRAAEIGIGPP